MRSFILYSALRRITGEHKPVDTCTGHCIYIRAELVDCDYNEAMDRVKPMEGEIFLNCVPAEKS